MFDNFKPNWDVECQQIKIRLGYWAKGWCEDFPISPENLVNNLRIASLWKNKPRITRPARCV